MPYVRVLPTNLPRFAGMLFAVAAIFAAGVGMQQKQAAAVPSYEEREPDRGVRAVERARLFAALKAAPDEPSGRRAEDAIWHFWMAGSDIATNQLVADAMRARGGYNFDRALELLNSAIERDPKFAEAWNQRAFIYFLKEDYERSLADVEKMLELEPKHFAALSGRALIYMRQGRSTLMVAALKKAVAIHPWLKERHMLPAKDRPAQPTPKAPETHL